MKSTANSRQLGRLPSPWVILACAFALIGVLAFYAAGTTNAGAGIVSQTLEQGQEAQ